MAPEEGKATKIASNNDTIDSQYAASEKKEIKADCDKDKDKIEELKKIIAQQSETMRR